MGKLRAQFITVTCSIFVISASLYFYLYYTQAAIHNFSERAALLGFSWNAIPVGLTILYQRYLWKFFNPKLDFGGNWEFTEKHHDWVYGQPEKFVHAAQGSMRVEQTALEISVAEGQTSKSMKRAGLATTPMSSWFSIACELSSDGKQISLALDHQSAAQRVKYGVEIISVTKRGFKERPIEMSSRVYHCVGAGIPRIVTVKYVRRDAT